MTSPDPYRDERASLSAENERLRAEVASLRGERTRRGVAWAGAIALAALHALALAYLPGLVNASDDGRVYLGFASALALVLADVAFAVWWFSKRGSQRP